MKLTSLTRAELGDLQNVLTHIAAAADALVDGGFDPVISLSESETRLTMGSILADDAGDALLIEIETPPVEVEPAPARVDPSPRAAVADMLQPAPENVDHAVEADKSTLIPGGTWSERVRGEDGLWRGPWLPTEDAKVVDLRAHGETYRTIGDVLERSKAAVAFRANNALAPAIVAAAKALKSGGVSTSRAPGKPPVAAVAGARAVTPRPVPAEVKAPAEAAAGGDLIQNPEAVRAPQSVATDAGPRDAAPFGRAHAPAGSGPAPAASNGPLPAVPPQGVAKKSNGWGECPADLSADARALWHDLAWLKPDPVFDINLDLDLCNGLARGRPLGELALELDVDAAVAKARFAHLTATIRNDKGVVTLAGQAALLSVLKRRVGVPA